jgi:hypothetical protein
MVSEEHSPNMFNEPVRVFRLDDRGTAYSSII